MYASIYVYATEDFGGVYWWVVKSEGGKVGVGSIQIE